MENLPNHHDLDINALSRVFKNTTNSYKFFWMIALLDCIREGRTEVSIYEMCLKMLENVWYPRSFFKLNFGVQDQFSRIINDFDTSGFVVDYDSKNDSISTQISDWTKNNPHFIKKIMDLGKYVPTRFIRPWYESDSQGLADDKVDAKIRELSNDGLSLYFIHQNQIVISPKWIEYLVQHQEILRSYTQWYLLVFLQAKNPNTPAISAKLEKPKARSLAKANEYWKTFMEISPNQKCIYSGAFLSDFKTDIDHFLPWSFVAHDQIWNLAPVGLSANRSKSDKLPDLSFYIEPFALLQQDALGQIRNDHFKTIQLDFATIMRCEIRELRELNSRDFTLRMREVMSPLEQIARGMGFTPGWKYE